jgi:hypothetical protein
MAVVDSGSVCIRPGIMRPFDLPAPALGGSGFACRP